MALASPGGAAGPRQAARAAGDIPACGRAGPCDELAKSAHEPVVLGRKELARFSDTAGP